MVKRKDNQPKHPFMYIVQPDISIPQSEMQEQFRMALGPEEVEISEVSDEIRVVSQEDVEKKQQVKKQKAQMEEVHFYMEEAESLEARDTTSVFPLEEDSARQETFEIDVKAVEEFHTQESSAAANADGKLEETILVEVDTSVSGEAVNVEEPVSESNGGDWEESADLVLVEVDTSVVEEARALEGPAVIHADGKLEESAPPVEEAVIASKETPAYESPVSANTDDELEESAPPVKEAVVASRETPACEPPVSANTDDELEESAPPVEEAVIASRETPACEHAVSTNTDDKLGESAPPVEEAMTASEEEVMIEQPSFDNSREHSEEAVAVDGNTGNKEEVNLENAVEQNVHTLSAQLKPEVAEPSKKRQFKKNIKPAKKKLSMMTKEEILTFLVRMPSAVPKPVCTIGINGNEVMGQVQKKKDDLYYLKIGYGNKTEIITVAMDAIDYIQVENW